MHRGCREMNEEPKSCPTTLALNSRRQTTCSALFDREPNRLHRPPKDKLIWLQDEWLNLRDCKSARVPLDKVCHHPGSRQVDACYTFADRNRNFCCKSQIDGVRVIRTVTAANFRPTRRRLRADY